MTELNVNDLIPVGTDNVVLSRERGSTQSERMKIIIVNTSTAGQVITLSIDKEAEALHGFPLSVGGFYAESKEAFMNCTQKQICAISSAAGGQVSIMERNGAD